MLVHDYVDMPGQLGDQVLRCKWCMKTPSKAREDGCPMRELQEVGHITLKQFNPGGVERFKNRTCVTCSGQIMEHWLLWDGNPAMRDKYWCTVEGDQFSEGVNDCKHDVSMVSAPVEQTEPRRPFSVQMRVEYNNPTAEITNRGD